MGITEKIELLNQTQQERLLTIIDEWLEGGEENGEEYAPPRHTLYPIKTEYSVEDIKAIVNLFLKIKNGRVRIWKMRQFPPPI